MQPGLIAGGPPSPKAFDCIGAQANVELPRHRWYFVKEAFSRHVVTSAIEDAGVKRDDVVLDPFAGSGTVPLSCSEGGIRGVGIEVNPFLAAVARAKLLQDQPETVRRHAKTVYRGAARGARSPLESFSTFSESGGFPKWLFNQGVLRAFEGGWRETAELRPPVGALLRLARISHTVTAEGRSGSVGAEFLPREQVEQEQAALRPCFREARVAGTAA